MVYRTSRFRSVVALLVVTCSACTLLVDLHGLSDGATGPVFDGGEAGDDLGHDPFVDVDAEVPDSGLLVVAVLEDPGLEPVEVRRSLPVEDPDRLTRGRIDLLTVGIRPAIAQAGEPRRGACKPPGALLRGRERQDHRRAALSLSETGPVVVEAVLIGLAPQNLPVRPLDERGIRKEEGRKAAEKAPIQAFHQAGIVAGTSRCV